MVIKWLLVVLVFNSSLLGRVIAVRAADKSSFRLLFNLNEVQLREHKRVFYVCSYGGSGSYMLSRFLDAYGLCIHIHSRKPPELLKVICEEQFCGESLDEEEALKITVIFIYKNPTNAQLSRWSKSHFKNIGIELDILMEDYVTRGEDLLKYEEFFDNYVNKRINRNYQITTINYHKLWDNLPEVFTALDLPLEDISKFPPRVEGSSSYLKDLPDWVVEGLNKINAPLIKKIEAMPVVKTIGPSHEN